MGDLRLKLERAIARSERAYTLYAEEKKYYQALRIRNANQVIYELLEEFLLECDSDEVSMTQEYIFHLEDWFHQFYDLELQKPALESEFVFVRFKNSPAYPRNFIEIIKSEEL